MTHAAPTPPAPHPRSTEVQSRRISRIPAFAPVPVRARSDGWHPVRQAEFIGHLAETRCVRTAARRVGMSRESVYRLRKRRGAEEFAAAWEAIMGVPGAPRPKVTFEALYQRIQHGSFRPVMRGGRYVGTLQKPDNSALLRALSQSDRTAKGAERRFAEMESHTKQKGLSA